MCLDFKKEFAKIKNTEELNWLLDRFLYEKYGMRSRLTSAAGWANDLHTRLGWLANAAYFEPQVSSSLVRQDIAIQQILVKISKLTAEWGIAKQDVILMELGRLSNKGEFKEFEKLINAEDEIFKELNTIYSVLINVCANTLVQESEDARIR